MTFYWKHEKHRRIPEISQDFYYRQSNFIITLFKCWREKSFLTCLEKLKQVFDSISRCSVRVAFFSKVLFCSVSSQVNDQVL